jgi:hypothetical protein
MKYFLFYYPKEFLSSTYIFASSAHEAYLESALTIIKINRNKSCCQLCPHLANIARVQNQVEEELLDKLMKLLALKM